MKRGKWILALFFLGSAVAHSNAQKKWDGQGGDGLWNNERNWYPDGIPLPSDDVLINNQYIAGSYKILFPAGTFTASVNSLSMVPDAGGSITLEIPVGNTSSPCLTMLSTGNAFRIARGGLFINNSGASAGNAIDVNGKFLIENLGRYVHKTLRGNATIVSKLMLDTSTQKGIFEFDVPGNSGYIISISGREFGSLWLSSLTAGKKSYSGSGASSLRVHGDFLVDDSSSFTSSLNNAVYIGRNLIVKGKFSLNPTLKDSMSRELLFDGDSTSVQVKGTMSFGSNFRNVVVAKGIFQLKSNLLLPNPTLVWKLAPHASMMMDEFLLDGAGKLETDSSSILGIGSIGGIAGDSAKGNVGMQSLSLHPKANYVFYGSRHQYTGNRFPAAAAGLYINKPAGGLTLSSSVLVTDSLGLIRGNILTDSNRILVFSGNKISGRPVSFIIGPFRYIASSKKDLHFPVGKDSVFAPMVISKNTAAPAVFQVEYHPRAADTGNASMAFPIKSISTREYWEFKKISPPDTVANQDLIRLLLGVHSTAGITGQPLIARKATGEAWQLLPLYANDTYPNAVSSLPQRMSSGMYTFGSMHPVALPLETLGLCYQERNGFTKLSWTSNFDETVNRYVVEKSSADGPFMAIDTVESKNRMGKTSYNQVFRSSFVSGSCIRIRSEGKNGKEYCSNIIFMRNAREKILLYPNPTRDFIRIGPNIDKGSFIGILNQAGQFVATTSFPTENGLQVNTSHLSAGKYTLVLSGSDKPILRSFIIR